jgi:hypothetical protein
LSQAPGALEAHTAILSSSSSSPTLPFWGAGAMLAKRLQPRMRQQQDRHRDNDDSARHTTCIDSAWNGKVTRMRSYQLWATGQAINSPTLGLLGRSCRCGSLRTPQNQQYASVPPARRKARPARRFNCACFSNRSNPVIAGVAQLVGVEGVWRCGRIV